MMYQVFTSEPKGTWVVKEIPLNLDGNGSLCFSKDAAKFLGRDVIWVLTTSTGGKLVLRGSNISAIRGVTDEELAKGKEEYEKGERDKQGRLIRPVMTIPGQR